MIRSSSRTPAVGFVPTGDAQNVSQLEEDLKASKQRNSGSDKARGEDGNRAATVASDASRGRDGDGSPRSQVSSVVTGNRSAGWKVSDKLQALSIAVAVVIAIPSLVISVLTYGALQRARIVMESNSTNSNRSNFERHWTRWVDVVSDTTKYVGVCKRIKFKSSFQRVPRVLVAFNLLNVRSAADALIENGYHFADSTEARRMREQHVVVFALNVSDSQFDLCVGVGVSAKSGSFLERILGTVAPRAETVNWAKDGKRIDKLGEDERWMLRFYEVFGTTDVSWIAQEADT